jgi:hypothetical protein
MYPCLIMAKKASPATSALGARLLTNCSDTEDLPAPGGPVTRTSSPTAALSLIAPRLTSAVLAAADESEALVSQHDAQS